MSATGATPDSGHNDHHEGPHRSPSSRLPGRAVLGRLDSVLGGNPFAGISGHVVVVGAGPPVAGMLTNLERDSRFPPEVIVVVPPSAAASLGGVRQVREQLDLVGSRRQRVHLVIAEPDDATWDWVRLDHVTQVVITATGDQSDLDVAGLAVEVERRLGESEPPQPPLVLVLESAANASAVRPPVADDDHVHLYVRESLAAGALSRMATHPHFSAILGGIGPTGFYAVGGSGLVGTPFSELLPNFSTGIPVGIVGQNGTATFLPAPDHPLGATEKIVVLASNRVSARVRADSAERPTLPSATVGAADAPVAQLLIVGWSPVAAGILARRSAAGLPVGEVTVFSAERPESFPEDLPTPRHFRGDPLDEHALRAVCDQLSPEAVVVTSSAGDTDSDATLTAVRMADAGADHVFVDRVHPVSGWTDWAGSDVVELVTAADILASRLAGSLTDPMTTIARREVFSDRGLTFERIRINSVPENQPITLASLYMGLLPSRSAPIAVSRFGGMLSPEDPFSVGLQDGDEVLLLSRRLP